LPIVSSNTKFQDLIIEMTSKKLGVCLVLDNHKLVGVITDGDLRRAMAGGRFNALASEIMTTNPKIIESEMMAIEAEEFMVSHKIKELVVMEEGRVCGIVQLYDIGRI
ncbi:MAG: CBS domain-containing protein, partial [Helicobacter sp.]|nr:CBS domain-containing protein [Helicobacter sp.]